MPQDSNVVSLPSQLVQVSAKPLDHHVQKQKRFYSSLSFREDICEVTAFLRAFESPVARRQVLPTHEGCYNLPVFTSLKSGLNYYGRTHRPRNCSSVLPALPCVRGDPIIRTQTVVFVQFSTLASPTRMSHYMSTQSSNAQSPSPT